MSLLFFLKDGFGIKLHTKVDMPLNKETEPIIWRKFLNNFPLIEIFPKCLYEEKKNILCHLRDIGRI